MTDDELLDLLWRAGGGGPGAVAQALPSVPSRASFDLAERVPQAGTRVEAVLAQLHADVQREDPSTDEVRFAGWIGSGFLHLNPTLLAVVVTAAPSGPSSQVTVAASAKEGLIKQRSAEKAVDRVRDALVRP